VIGWNEWLAIPTLNIDRIKAKVDSGARTSSLHAFNIQKFMDRGTPHVAFVVHPLQRIARPVIQCTAEIRDERLVRSSNGHEGYRYVIEVEAILGSHTWPIELTLADRDAMGFRMLLGRQAISGRFLIDPRRAAIAGRSFANLKYSR